MKKGSLGIEKLKLIQEMEDGESMDKSNIKMIQELWSKRMTVPKQWFEADRTIW